VYGEPAFTYEFNDLVQADLPAVQSLRRDPGCQVTIDDAEEDGLKYRSVVGIEWAVDEYVALVAVECDVL
jgi:hypothetical protein